MLFFSSPSPPGFQGRASLARDLFSGLRTVVGCLLLGDVVLLIQLCLSRSRQIQKQGLHVVVSGLFLQGNRLTWG